MSPHQQAIPQGIFDQADQLSPEEKETIISFLTGQNRQNPDPSTPVRQFLLHSETKAHPESGGAFTEMLVFEINYSNGTWRKLRR
jgi:hypothetical protein